MINSNDEKTLFVSGLAAAAVHMLAAAVAIFLAVYGFQKIPEISVVYLVGSEAAEGYQALPKIQKADVSAATAVSHSVAPSAEKIISETDSTATKQNVNVMPVTVVQTEKVRSGSDPVASTAANRVSIETFPFGSVSGPDFLQREIPVYPFMARRMNKEGRVLLKLAIDEKGNLLKAEVIEPAGFGFTESALEAVRKSTYRPAIKNGVPAPSLALLPVRFRLADQ
jgi:periplasmic protein TonB